MNERWASAFRVVVGFYWLYFASTKWQGVGWTRDLIQSAGAANPIPGLREILTNVVAPNWFIFSVIQTVGETVVALLLIVGLSTRWDAVLVLMLAIGLVLVVAFAVNDVVIHLQY